MYSKNLKKLILNLSVISLCASSNIAFAATKDSVLDKYGKPVISNLSQNCVRSKWIDNNDICDQGNRAVAENKIAEPKNEPINIDRSYLVFFDFNRTSVNPDARSVLANIVDGAKGIDNVTYILTGHADSVGSDAVNEIVSKRRADAVKRQLINLGVSAKNIQTTWKGEKQLLVPTADNIKEPQNRRVEINLR